MFDKILQFFVKLLPEPLKKLYDKFEELIVYVYYGVLTTIVNLIVQFGVQYGIMSPCQVGCSFRKPDFHCHGMDCCRCLCFLRQQEVCFQRV